MRINGFSTLLVGTNISGGHNIKRSGIRGLAHCLIENAYECVENFHPTYRDLQHDVRKDRYSIHEILGWQIGRLKIYNTDI
jgi:hypothetical protein